MNWADIEQEAKEAGVYCICGEANLYVGIKESPGQSLWIYKKSHCSKQKERIVAMTANAFEEDKKKAFKAGMNAHIAKPIDINTILAVFDQVFGV